MSIITDENVLVVEHVSSSQGESVICIAESVELVVPQIPLMSQLKK